MLPPDVVYSSYTGIPSGFRRSMLREYLQCKTLEFIFRKGDAPGLVFLGGTALRLFYGNGRFSEDLDFDCSAEDTCVLNRAAERVTAEFRLEGVDCAAKIREGSSSVTLRFPTILQNWELTGHRDEVVRLKLDAEPQNYSYAPQTKVLNRFDVITAVPVVPPELLLSQKLLAVLQRRRLMGRDLFDAAYLLGITHPDRVYLMEKTGASTMAEVLRLLNHRIAGVSAETLAGAVKPFMIRPEEAMRITMFRTILNERLKEV